MSRQETTLVSQVLCYFFQLHHFTDNEASYSIRMFACGFINTMDIFTPYAAVMAAKHDQNQAFAKFMVALQAVPPIVVLVNARFFMRTSHLSRVALSALLMAASYATFAYSFYYEDLAMAYVCCVLGIAA